MDTEKKVTLTTKLIVFSLLVVAFKGVNLLNLYRGANTTSVNPKVLGASLSKDVSFGFLPDYPILQDEAPKFAARQYTLFDADSGIFLVNQSASEPVPLASTTKIMTTILAIEELDLNRIHTVHRSSALQIGSTVQLRIDEKISVESLLYAALLNSGNDSAFSLAHELGIHYSNNPNIGYDDAINITVNKMNEKAKSLGLSSLSFTDPAGLDSLNVGTAQDMAKLAHYAVQNDTFKRFVGTAEKTVHSADGLLSHQLKNSNRLISEWNYPGAIGIKTGFTPEAGHNLIAAINYKGHIIIAVVFNTYADTKTASAEVARDILDFAQRSVNYH